jgi:hypothetical protein
MKKLSEILGVCGHPTQYAACPMCNKIYIDDVLGMPGDHIICPDRCGMKLRHGFPTQIEARNFIESWRKDEREKS